MKKRRGPGKVGIQPICMLLEPSSENNPNKHEMVEEKLYIDKDRNALQNVIMTHITNDHRMWSLNCVWLTSSFHIVIVESYELQVKQLFIDLQQIAYLAASLDKIHNFIIDCSSEHDENSKTTRS